MPWTWTYWCFSWKNVFGPPQKTMVVDRKKQNVLPLLRTQALCYKAICANRVRSRTDNKDEFLEGKFRNLNFLPPTKKTTEYSFEIFLSIYTFLKL